jgi:hypothetical protein
MKLTEFSRQERFWVQHPPVSILVAAYLRYEPPTSSGRKTTREAARANSNSMQAIVHPKIGTFGQFMQRGSKTLDQMPAYLRGPEKMAMIAEMKREITGESNGG